MDDAVTIPTDTGEMPAHLWLPPAGHGPGIVVLQEIFGVSDYIRRRAAQLAVQGYVVVAPEIFWRLGVTSAVEGEDALQQGMGLVQRLDWQAAVTDAAATVEWLRDRDEVTAGVGAVGFCFGGGLGFNVAAVDAPDVLVSYYGSGIPGLLDLAPQVTAPSLHHFGTADDYIDGPTVERIRAAVTAGDATVEFETYEGANHAFDNSDFLLHHPAASALAWERTLAFLARELPVA